MMARAEGQILQDVANLLRGFNGKEYSGEIGPQTQFFADLGLASIDAVMFAETLERFYGRSFGFGRLLSATDQSGFRDITVGEIAGFLHRQMISAGDTE
jgi:acyl carrier protein